ncbi:MAG: biotin--[acetyl-CoA-carboxylase] ligase [Acidimicrobiia bacterium]|nr:biotin--[acetyl-CoA-carboxylase] ligase [Acidimicrobiia bacterium]
MDTHYVLVSLEETSSTQDRARDLFDGTPVLVVARRQTAGRGRGGSSWETAPRALAASLALAVLWPPETWGRLPLVAGLSALQCLPAGLVLKWPNDVMRDGTKVAGILVEGSTEVAVVGMGINLWWSEPPAGYGAAFDVDPGEGVHLEIARCWASALLRRMVSGPEDWGRIEYRRSCATIGRLVRWQPGGVGVAEDIDDDGALLVRTDAGIERLMSGRVWEVRDDGSGLTR